jgi:MFS family permease
MTSRATSLLLNVAHALDHLFLLIFATAVGAIATDFGIARWEDLMPYGVGAFALYGAGSLPAGRLGDLWGRRRMMVIFFFGMGASSLLVAATSGPWSMAAALTLLGTFAAIYHPVGIPMLVRNARRPGLTIGVNGLAGNLGVALSAVCTGVLVKYVGWRAAFIVPGLVAIACGVLFARVANVEEAPPGRGVKGRGGSHASFARVLAVITIASITANLLFNLTTNGNGELLRERFDGLVADPALLGALLGGVYAIASLAQIVVGNLIDRVSLRSLYAGIVIVQVPLFALAAFAHGWAFYALMIAFMVVIFGAIPFTDATIVRYVDDSHRSRVTGMRMTVSLGASSLAVWALGPMVKAAGFDVLLLIMSAIACGTLVAVLFLPREQAEAGVSRAAPPGSPRAAD